jgi:hypothetical protein
MATATDALTWLLEPDTSQSQACATFALRDLLDQPADAPDVVAAQAAVMASGPVPAILAAQDRAGFWVEPGPGYYPKYTGTVWQITFLAQFGADGRDPARARRLRLSPRPQPLHLRRFQRGQQPQRHDPLSARQPGGRAPRPGLAGRPTPGRCAGLAGAQHHRRGGSRRPQTKMRRSATTAAATARPALSAPPTTTCPAPGARSRPCSR